MKCIAPLSVVGLAIVTANPIVCPSFDRKDSNGILQTSDAGSFRYSEISGIGFSTNYVGPSQEPILYGISDGPNARLGIWDSGTGERLMTLLFPGESRYRDFESLDVGPCQDNTKTCIFLGDTGDNTARSSLGRRTTRPHQPYHIVAIEEPNYNDYSDGETLPRSMVSVLEFDYKSETSPTDHADAEGIFVDPVGWGEGNKPGDVYIVTKWDGGQTNWNRLFKIPSDAFNDLDTIYSPDAVGDYSQQFGVKNDFLHSTWTSAAITNNGTVIALGGYSETRLFLRCPGTSIPEALFTNHCESWAPYPGGQLESTAFTPDGLRNLQIPEDSRPYMGWTWFYTSRNQKSCPILQYVNGNCQSTLGVSYPDAQCQAADAQAVTATTSPVTDAPTNGPTPQPILRQSPTSNPVETTGKPILVLRGPSWTLDSLPAEASEPTLSPLTLDNPVEMGSQSAEPVPTNDEFAIESMASSATDCLFLYKFSWLITLLVFVLGG